MQQLRRASVVLTQAALPHCWCTGADESYEQSAEREIDEEMGVKQVKLNPCFDFYHADEISRLWGRLFTCTYDGDFRLDPEEVESGKFMSVQVSTCAGSQDLRCRVVHVDVIATHQLAFGVIVVHMSLDACQYCIAGSTGVVAERASSA